MIWAGSTPCTNSASGTALLRNARAYEAFDAVIPSSVYLTGWASSGASTSICSSVFAISSCSAGLARATS